MKLYLHLATGTWYWLGTPRFAELKERKHVKEAITFVDDQTIEVHADLIQVGQDENTNEVIIEQPGIAPRHCILYQTHGKWYAQRISDHRTFLDDELVQTDCELKDSDELSFGTNTILDVILR